MADLLVNVKQFYPQTDSETSQADRMCRSSTVAMGIKFLKPNSLRGVNGDDKYLQKLLTFGDTTFPEPHVKAAATYNVGLVNYTNGVIEDLLSELRAGYPVGVAILHHGPVDAPRGGGHWMLLVGATETHGIFHDPYGELDNVNGGYDRIGPFGKFIKYSWINWLKRWSPEGVGHGYYCTFRDLSPEKEVEEVETTEAVVNITKATLAHIWSCQPSDITDAEISDLNICLNGFQITNHSRLCHFLSQTAHECGRGKWMEELASGKDYEFRADLGNVSLGDGPRYKGAGVIQLTGRYNYQQLSNFLEDPRVMEGVSYVSVNLPFTSAGFWWRNNKMNELCDRKPSVEEVTLRVNGGTNGLADRQQLYRKCLDVIFE